MRIEYGDQRLREFCEHAAGAGVDLDLAVRPILMRRLAVLRAAMNIEDVLAMRVLGFVPLGPNAGSIRVGETHFLHIEFQALSEPTVVLRSLKNQALSGVNNG